MGKINIILEGSHLNLNGQEKTLKDIKETLYSSYGYLPEKILFYTDKNFKNFIPDDLINLNAMDNLNLYIKYINDENKLENIENFNSDNSSSECSSEDFYPNDLRNVFEKLNEKFKNEKNLLNKKRKIYAINAHDLFNDNFIENKVNINNNKNFNIKNLNNNNNNKKNIKKEEKFEK